MSADDEIAAWLTPLAKADPQAAQRPYERVFERMVRLAKGNLTTSARRTADEEDVALSAFDSFVRGAQEGRFPRLADRHDLWKVLMTITLRKARAQNRQAGRYRRGGGEVRGESVFVEPLSGGEAGIEQFAIDSATPETAALLQEEVEQRLEQLANQALRDLALRKLEGYSIEGIAAALGCSIRTVERRLESIRAK